MRRVLNGREAEKAMKIIKKTAFLFILLTAMTAGVFAQRGGDKKPPPPPKPDRPVVIPKEKPKEKPKKPEFSFYAISPGSKYELI